VYVQRLGAVSRYLRRRVARDAVDDSAADVFAIAWRKGDTVAAGEELPWLYRIASYQVANHRRRLAARASVVGLFAVPDSAPSAESLVSDDAELARAWAAIGARDRKVLALVVLDDPAVGDAAVALGKGMPHNLPGASGTDSDPTSRLQSMRQAPDADAPHAVARDYLCGLNTASTPTRQPRPRHARRGRVMTYALPRGCFTTTWPETR
jgi:hypothetical protein